MWLENFLLDFKNTIIIVSHNRHFLNKVCTHICDVDYGHINMYVGNYDFWYETNQLLAKQAREANKKAEARAKELQEFIARFSANASKSRQATSRKKEFQPHYRLCVEVVGRLVEYQNIGIAKKRLRKQNLDLKSTFLKILSGALEPTKGTVSVGKNQRISVLNQNQNDFDDCTVMRTVLMGHKRLVDIMDQKDAL